jgi:hypothetical protein
MAKKQSIIAAEQGINSALVAEGLKAKSANRTKFWTPKDGCIYKIKSVADNLLLEADINGDVVKEVEVNIDFLIPFLFSDPRAEEWSQAHVHDHNDLDDPIFLDWFVAVPYEQTMYRLKKTSNPRQGQLYSESKDQYYALVEARGAYQWQPYSFD